jgi:serine/threonine protein kinase
MNIIIPGRIEKSSRNTYKFIQYIGAGGYGETWKAENMDTGEYVAIKVYHLVATDINSRLKIKRNLDQELEALIYINSVCKEYGVCYKDVYYWPDESGEPRLVMELINGNTLVELINKIPLHIRLDDLNLLRDLVLGLDTFHSLGVSLSKGISHQDIKEGNLMYDIKNNKYKFIDWGGACINSVKCTRVICEVPCGYIGTTYASPPEITQGFDLQTFDDTKAHDIWSIGVVLYDWYSFALSWKQSFLTQYQDKKYLKQYSQDEINNKILKYIPIKSVQDILQKLLTRDKRKRLENWNTVVNFVKTNIPEQKDKYAYILSVKESKPLTTKEKEARLKEIKKIPTMGETSHKAVFEKAMKERKEKEERLKEIKKIPPTETKALFETAMKERKERKEKEELLKEIKKIPTIMDSMDEHINEPFDKKKCSNIIKSIVPDFQIVMVKTKTGSVYCLTLEEIIYQGRFDKNTNTFINPYTNNKVKINDTILISQLNNMLFNIMFKAFKPV